MSESYIVIGKIGATHGIHGWLKIHAYTEIKANILSYDPWYISDPQAQWQPLSREDSKVSGDLILAKFPGLDTPEEARLLTGKEIAITRGQLPKLKNNEYYWSDLIGLTVINKTGEVYGKVIYLIETGSNDVLVVKNESKEQAIPFLMGSVILSVDLIRKEIHVDWESI